MKQMPEKRERLFERHLPQIVKQLSQMISLDCF